jgi:FeS assembly SUF system protein
MDAQEPKVLNSIEKSLLENEIIQALQQVYDPELPVNIYDLGLIYGIEISDSAEVKIIMTLTSPMCPVAGTLPGEAQAAAAAVPGATSVEVELTWDPPFTIDRMSEEARLQLGF